MQLKQLMAQKSAENYQYLPFQEADVQLFEKKHQITLPEGFRDYLLHLANGGMGPNNGIYPLSTTHTYEGIDQSWVDPEAYHALRENDFSTPLGQTLIEASRKGTLYLCDRGGGFSTFLVITGPNRGQVWYDNTVTDEGFILVAEDFLSWYENWIDDNIRVTKKKIKDTNQTILRVDSITPEAMPQETYTLNMIIGAFMETKDVEPVMDFIHNYLDQENIPQHIFETLMDYLLDTEELTNHSLALEFITKAAGEAYAKDPIFRKKMLCHEGDALVGLERYDMGISSFEKALDLHIDFYPKGLIPDKYIKKMGYAHLSHGKMEKALATMEPFNETHSIVPAIELLGDLREKHARPDLAIAWGENLLRWKPFTGDPNYRNYLVSVYLELVYSSIKENDKRLLNSFLEELLDAQPNPELIPFDNIALELYNSKRYSIALDILKRYEGSSRAKNNIPWLYNMMGCCYDGLKDYPKAKEYFKKSFEINRWIVPYSNLIRPHIFLGQNKMAKQIFDEVVDFDPYYSWSYYQFSIYYIKNNEHHKAIDLLLRAVSLGFDENEIKSDSELVSVLVQFKTIRG